MSDVARRRASAGCLRPPKLCAQAKLGQTASVTPTAASAALAVLRRMEPERAHRLALRALALGLAGRDRTEDDPRLAISAFGLRFRNPIGLAAGFDKDAEAVGALMRLGFGLVEVGTVTPLPQPGNARPRLFRLPEDRAVINRMGFNNRGLEAFLRRLQACPRGGVPIGANVGINAQGADPERDYPALVAAVAPLADYIVINISSPNTPGLRDLQGAARLRSILQAVAAKLPRRPPLLVKVAPDLTADALAAVVQTCVAEGAQGLVVSNTTLARPGGLRSRHAQEPGGLSGAPLLALSTAALAQAARAAPDAVKSGRLALVGVGGIASGRDVLAKLRAGASLVQLYTAFAYSGPPLIPRLRREVLVALHEQGFASVADAVGADIG
jgi:dihydroorotate dehydrogenase